MMLASYIFLSLILIIGCRIISVESLDCASNPCQNCGTCTDTPTYKCICPPQFTGVSCETPVVTAADVRDCSENGANAYSGVYNLIPSAKGVRGPAVWCDMTTDGGRWTVIQKRIDGRVNFNRNWTEYENGFGYPNLEYWLGNSWLYLLISSNLNWELRVDMERFDGKKYYAKYNTFKIGGCETSYTLTTANGYSGDYNDSLKNDVGSKFSTPDRDNDGNAENCAAYLEGGFWYSEYGCGTCQVNCVYRHPGESYHWGIYWMGIAEFGNSLKYIDMKIRPNS